MIFNKIELDDTPYEATGQLRIKEDNGVKIIFDDLMFANKLKELYAKEQKIEKLVIKNSEETRYETKSVSVSHLTIDSKYYHATFK